MILMLIITNASAQNNFIKTISATYGIVGNYGIQCKDNGYLAVATLTDSAYSDTNQNTVYTSDIYVIKLNNIGDSLWSHRYGGLQNENALQVAEANDSSIYILGTDSLNNGLLIKLKPNGNLIWTKTYANIYLQQLIIKQNTVLLLGETNSNTSSTININILNCDTSGVVTIQKTYGINSNNDYFISADTSINNGLLMLGRNNSITTMYKLNSQLDTLWTKSYFNSNYRPVKIINSDDNSAVLMFSYGTFPVQNMQPRAIKISLTNGSIVWQQNYFDNLNFDIVSDMLKYNNDEMVVGGTINQNLIGDSNQMYVMIIDKNGNQLSMSKRSMFDASYLSIVSMKITADNGMLLTGTKNNSLIISKTDNSFVPVAINQNISKNKSIIPYPIPAKEHLTINLSNEEIPSQIIIYDINGRQIINTILNNNTNNINIINLETGIYIYEIKTKENISKGKIIKL